MVIGILVLWLVHFIYQQTQLYQARANYSELSNDLQRIVKAYQHESDEPIEESSHPDLEILRKILLNQGSSEYPLSQDVQQFKDWAKLSETKTPTKASIRVVLYDDDPIYQQQVRKVLQDTSYLELVGSFDSANDSLNQCKRILPDVILMDIKMDTDTDGLLAAKEIHKVWPTIKICMFSTFNYPHYIFEALHVGASSYLSKDINFEEIPFIIKMVMRGDLVINENAAINLRTYLQYILILNEEDREIFPFVIKNLPPRKIAQALNLPPRTVYTRIRRLKKRCGVQSEKDLIEKFHFL